MTYTDSGLYTKELSTFQQLDVDQQLALLWFVYKEMGKSVTPAAPNASTVSPAIAEGLFEQVKALSHDEQLQVQRDLVAGQNTQICREYGALSDTTKLLFWYLLACGMDESTIVPFPDNYELSGNAKTLLGSLQGLDFNQQITLLRDIVSPMGVDPAVVPHDSETGL
jgi:Orange carotenoid protein, N-terminal